MKVDESAPPAASNNRQKEPERPFKDLLREPRASGPRRAGVKLPVATRTQPVARQAIAIHERTARTLKEARGAHDAQADGLSLKADEHRGRALRTIEDRVLDRIVAEAEAPRRPPSELPVVVKPPDGVSLEPGRTSAAAAPRKTTEVRGLREVVEQIEVFVRSGRPGLSLTVGGSLQAQVTVERTGAGQVALSFRGKNGPPSAQDVRAVRAQLEARGLRLTAMKVC